MRALLSAVWILIISLSVVRLSAAELPVAVESSGSAEVDDLVRQLVSDWPAPYPTGYTKFSPEAAATPYRSPQVTSAMLRLKALGPRIYPILVKHRADDRYSFSDAPATWANRTVGEAILEVLSDGHLTHSGYKYRRTLSGSVVYLSFQDYLQDRDPERWAEWAKNKNPLEIQLDFIEWSLEKERARGFADEPQRRKVLEFYAQARESVRRQYADLAAPSGPSKP